MKTIMFAAPSSGSGKTTVTMAVIRALKNRGYSISPYKTGPDYIDTAFLSKAAGTAAGNLDLHLMGTAGVKNSLALSKGDIRIVEGAMGYFDGISNTFINSSYNIADKFSINTVLVYSPKGEMFSAIPKIKGMADFSKGRIRAVIFNGVTADHYNMLKEKLEEYTELIPLGYFPKIKEAELKSRHLGLVQSVEVEDIEDRLKLLSEEAEKCIDLDKIIELTSDLHIAPDLSFKKRNIKTAIAKDEGFNFYYSENLKLLEECTEVTYFSPIRDKEIPECDFLYIGGGYPEVFIKELSENQSMKKSIKDYAEAGGFIFAECGGFMYLTDSIEGYEMCGVLKGKSYMTERLQRFGYIDVTLKSDCILGKTGDVFTAHEFHRSKVETESEEVYAIKKTGGSKSWECGYTKGNVLGGYPHINFFGNMDIFENLLNNIEMIKNNQCK